MAFRRILRRWRGEEILEPSRSAPAVVVTPPEPSAQPVVEALPPPVEPKVREVSTVAELDAMLMEVDAAHAISDDAVRTALRSFKYAVDFAGLPSDPFSAEYAQYQLDLYELIAGRPYRIENERSSFLSGDPSSLPFPYTTQSWKTVSDHLMLTGLIIRTLALPSKASVLEFGSGWGNTTLALAQMGYQVTAIDIEQRFLDMVEHRCRGLINPPRLLCRDFAGVGELEDKFDAIVFDASFHHCRDHRALLAALVDRLKPGGKVLFAAEPIDEMLPMPWGLRLDGGSVWSTRCFGWLELGFTETYFREAAGRAGFSVEKVHHPVDEFATMYVARPK